MKRVMEIIPLDLKVCLIRSQPMHLLPVIIQRYYLNDDIVTDLDWQGGLTGLQSHIQEPFLMTRLS